MTIDGLEEEFSTAKKVHLDGWDLDNKKAVSGLDFKKVNSELNTIKVSLESYFLVLRTQYEDVTPLMLKTLIKTLPRSLIKMHRNLRKLRCRL